MTPKIGHIRPAGIIPEQQAQLYGHVRRNQSRIDAEWKARMAMEQERILAAQRFWGTTVKTVLAAGALAFAAVAIVAATVGLSAISPM